MKWIICLGMALAVAVAVAVGLRFAVTTPAAARAPVIKVAEVDFKTMAEPLMPPGAGHDVIRDCKAATPGCTDASFLGQTHWRQTVDTVPGYLDFIEWKDTNTDGVTEKSWPMAFPSASPVVIGKVTFKVGQNFQFGGNVQIRGVATYTDLNSDQQTIVFDSGNTITQAGDELVAQNLTSVGNLPSFVFPYSMQIEWEIKQGANTHNAGASVHKLYVTLAEPLHPDRLYLTTVDLGTNGASGQTTPDGVVSGIWSQFKMLDVNGKPVAGHIRRRILNPTSGQVDANSGDILTYYDPTNKNNDCLDALTAEGLLSTPSAQGQCGSWADLYTLTVRTQGIAQVTRYTVKPQVGDGFWVKDWNWALGHAGDLVGVPGQNNPDPPAEFGLHFVVCYRTSGGMQEWYDPSYGSGPFGGQFQWEEASLDGFWDPKAANDPTRQETIFTVSDPGDPDVCSPGVGGTAEFRGQPDAPASAADSAGSSTPLYAALAGGIAAAALAFSGSGWYARRRWLR